MSYVRFAAHKERPIPPRAVSELYDHVGWERPGVGGDIVEILGAGPALGAWDADRLVGFARALTDGHFAAYVEDVMVHEGVPWARGGGAPLVVAPGGDRRFCDRQPLLRASGRPVLRG